MQQLPQDARELARDHWPWLLEKAGVDAAFLRKTHGPCPLCGGTDRFRFDNKDGRGTYFCNKCGAGDGFKLLMGHLGMTNFRDAADFVREKFGLSTPKEREEHRVKYGVAEKEVFDPEVRRKKLQECWDSGRPVQKGDPVWKYLVNTRKLPESCISRVLRYVPRAPYWRMVKDKNGEEKPDLLAKLPMMVAKVQGPDGKPDNLHRSYLTEHGEKADLGKDENGKAYKTKKLMKGLKRSGGAIRLFPAEGDILALAEGIETALSVRALTGFPVWATVSSTMMKSVVIPEWVKTVYIYADNDSPDENDRRAGQDAAKVLSERLQAEGKKVRIVLPTSADTDINDVWQARVAKTRARAERKAAKARRPREEEMLAA